MKLLIASIQMFFVHSSILIFIKFFFMEQVSIIFVFFFILFTSYSSSPFNLLFFLHWQPNNILHILQWKYLDIKLCVGLLFYVHGLYSFPFHVLVGYFASVCAPFTLFGAHNFFTLSMVFAMLRMIVYREVLISTECCASVNVTF